MVTDMKIDPHGPALLDQFILIATEQEDKNRRETEPHQHAAGQLLASTRGLLSVSSEGNLWVVPATHGVWIPPHHSHAIRSHGPFSGSGVFIAEQACSQLPTAVCTLRMSALLRAAIHRAAPWGAEPRTQPQQRLLDVIHDEIVALPKESLVLPLPADPRLAKIATALLDNLADGRSLDAWAAWAGISGRSLSRHFVNQTGFTFTKWRQRARLFRALEHLAAGISVTAIAVALGYDNVSAFIAMFRRTFGVTPTQHIQQQAIWHRPTNSPICVPSLLKSPTTAHQPQPDEPPMPKA